jgi:hypothetical protein
MTAAPRAKPEFIADHECSGAIGRRMREIARAEGRPAPLQDKVPTGKPTDAAINDYYGGVEASALFGEKVNAPYWVTLGMNYDDEITINAIAAINKLVPDSEFADWETIDGPAW